MTTGAPIPAALLGLGTFAALTGSGYWPAYPAYPGYAGLGYDDGYWPAYPDPGIGEYDDYDW